MANPLPGLIVIPGAILGAALWVFWRPYGMWVFLGATLLFILWVVLGNVEARQRLARIRPVLTQYLGEDEIGLLERCPAYFLYPMTARGISGAYSAIALLTIPLAVVLLLQRRWWELPFLIPVYAVLGPLSARLNPSFILRERKDYESHLAADAIDRLLQFIQVELPEALKEQSQRQEPMP